MIDPQAIKENQARMERRRSSYDEAWGQIARMVYPELADGFQGKMAKSQFMRDQARTEGPHDPYTTLALQDGVSVFESHVMPRGQRWQGFEADDDALMRKVENRGWFENVSLRLFKLRNDPQSGFVAGTHESAQSLFAFGPQSMWVDDRWDAYGRWAGISYQSEFIGDIWIERDASGNLLRIHRRIAMTAEQAGRKWHDKVPPMVAKALAPPNANPQSEFTFLHVIEPNRRFDAERIDLAGMAWHAGYYCEQDPDAGLFQEGGYRSLPRIFSCFARTALSLYGRSPTFTVFPYVRQQQTMFGDRMFGAELRLLPPLLTADDELDNAVLELSGLGVTEGGLNERGEPLIREFLTAADATDAKELTAELRAVIDRVFYRDLLQLNREQKTHISATRTEEEKVEKGLLLAPLARQEADWLSPMTQRELAIMEERGLLDDMPGEVAEYLGAGGALSIKYDNGLSALQEASKSAAFLSLAGQVGALAQFDPTYIEKFNREFPPSRVIPALGRIARVSPEMQATDAERAEYDRKQAEEAQRQQMLDAAPVLNDLAKTAAQNGQGMAL